MQETEKVLIGLGLIFLSSIGSVLWNLFAKTSCNKQIFLSLSITGSAITMLIANAFGIHLNLVSTSIPKGFYLVILTDAMLLAAAFTFLAVAYKEGEMSVVFPVWRMFPLFVYVFSLFFLNEVISLFSSLGICLSVFGVYLTAMKRFDFVSLISPFNSIRNRVFVYAVAASLCTSSSFILQKYMIPKVSPFIYNLHLQALGGFFMLLVNKLVFNVDFAAINKEWTKNRKNIVCVALIGPVTLTLSLYALYLIPASIAASFSQIGIVLGTIVGIILLKERELIGKKLISSIFICSGIIMIVAGY